MSDVRAAVDVGLSKEYKKAPFDMPYDENTIIHLLILVEKHGSGTLKGPKSFRNSLYPRLHSHIIHS